MLQHAAAVMVVKSYVNGCHLWFKCYGAFAFVAMSDLLGAQSWLVGSHILHKLCSMAQGLVFAASVTISSMF